MNEGVEICGHLFGKLAGYTFRVTPVLISRQQLHETTRPYHKETQKWNLFICLYQLIQILQYLLEV